MPLLLAPDGRRLSKREKDLDMGALREKYGAEEIIGRLAYLAGCNPTAEPKSAEELIADFDWDKVPQKDIRIPEGLF